MQQNPQLSDVGVYTVPEIAAILKISKGEAYRLAKREPFKIIKIGRSIRITKSSFNKWLDCELFKEGE